MTKREVALARVAAIIKAEVPTDQFNRLTDCLSAGVVNSDRLLLALGAKAQLMVKASNPAWEAVRVLADLPSAKELADQLQAAGYRRLAERMRMHR